MTEFTATTDKIVYKVAITPESKPALIELKLPAYASRIEFKCLCQTKYRHYSLHKLGLDARRIEEAASKQILDVLNLSNYDVIYTSGNAESFTFLINNIKGNVLTDNEDIESICKEVGISVNDGIVNKNTFVSVCDSNFYNGKIDHLNLDLSKDYNDLSRYDFITIEDDIPFFGVLLKKKNIEIENLIHGGKSTTKFKYCSFICTW